MLDLSDIRRRQLIYGAGLLYALSLHKYVSRDPLSMQTGIQGVLEFALQVGAFVCVFLAARRARRQYAASSAILCFGAYGIFALASSWRSFNPPLSLTKASLLFAVLAIGYLTSQLGLETRLFQSIYWTYTASLAVGLVLGVVFPDHFPLWSIDDFTGRTRLSVFGTFPGTMGETAAYLILLAPLLFRRPHWVSRLFLFAMNFLAGGKMSTVILVLLLAVEYCCKIRTGRSWRAVALVGCSSIAVCGCLYVTLVRGVDLSQWLSRSSELVYGHDVAGEAVSLDGRLDLWTGSLTMLIENPVLGYGFDGARQALMRIASWSGQSHNGILELGLAGGVLSVGIFLLGLAGVFRACLSSAPDLRRRSLLVFAYLIAISFTGITFNFPSYFGILVLTLLLYRSVQSTEQSVFSPLAQASVCRSDADGEPCRV
jgi:O-antigen ligase